MFVTGCAVLALHWCIKHSETAVQLYSQVVEVRWRDLMVEDQELSSPFQGEFEIKTFKSDALVIAASFQLCNSGGQLVKVAHYVVVKTL